MWSMKICCISQYSHTKLEKIAPEMKNTINDDGTKKDISEKNEHERQGKNCGIHGKININM